MTKDIETPANGERTPLLASEGTTNGTVSRDSSECSADDSTNGMSVSMSDSSIDEMKEELDSPWPATFDRGIQILAGPVLDEGKAADLTRSPVVRARYRHKNVSLVRLLQC